MAWQSMTADQKAERYDKAIADANALLAAAERFRSRRQSRNRRSTARRQSHIVKPHVDAWAIYEIRVRADSPEESARLRAPCKLFRD